MYTRGKKNIRKPRKQPKAKRPRLDPPVTQGDEESQAVNVSEKIYAEVSARNAPEVGKDVNKPPARKTDGRPEVKTLLENFEDDINKILLTKKKKIETFTKTSIKSCNQQIKNMWNIQEQQIQKLNNDFSEQFMTAFPQWDSDMKKFEEHQEKLMSDLREQQNVFQLSRNYQNKQLKTIRHVHNKFMKSLKKLEKINNNLLADSESELNKEISAFKESLKKNTLNFLSECKKKD